MEPDFYTRYYQATEHSPAHSRFCREVFGADLNQQGFADLAQLALLVNVAPITEVDAAIDIGCGNGKISEYLSDLTGARFDGLDNVEIAIAQASSRTAGSKPRLSFRVGDINDLDLPSGHYDVVLFIDTIYFSDDYQQTILRVKQSLKPAGRVVIFYSIGPALMGTTDFSRTLLQAEHTPLAEVLRGCGLTFRHRDLTTQEYELAKLRKRTLQALKPQFDREGIDFIYCNRMADSRDFIDAIEAGIHRRYLYCATC